MVYWRRAAEGDIAALGEYLLQCAIFIDHISAIVYRLARTAVGDVQLPALRIVGVGDGAARRKRDILRQI